MKFLTLFKSGKRHSSTGAQRTKTVKIRRSACSLLQPTHSNVVCRPGRNIPTFLFRTFTFDVTYSMADPSRTLIDRFSCGISDVVQVWKFAFEYRSSERRPSRLGEVCAHCVNQRITTFPFPAFSFGAAYSSTDLFEIIQKGTKTV